MDSLFEEGKIRVPLAAIRPAEQQCDQTHDLTAVLRDPTHLLACSISSHGRDALLRWLHCDSEHLRKAETPPLVQNQRVTCTYARHSLDQAKAELGENYTCNVHLYCVPPTPCKSCDGEVFRNVRFYMARADPRGIAVAQAWMNTLTDPKKHALALMLKRPNIMSALDRMLPFPGHWKGLQLGNWAKHLAAHIDPAIDNYWTHIKDTWAAIMAKDESMYHLVTADDVTRLQHRAPAWSSSDRRYIQDAFASHQLFPLIQGAEKREKILQIILRLRCVIPSIQTFHENMRYVAIGAKILEKLIQTPRRSRKPRDSIEPRAATLFENLACDWKASERSIQIANERYADLPGPADPYVAGLVLLLAALRYFPHLSAEKPLLGHEKEESRAEVIQFTDTEDAVMSDADSTVDVQSDVNDVDMEDIFGKARGGKRALQKRRRARTGPVHRAQAGGKQGEAGSTITGFGVRKLGRKGDSSNARKRKLRNQLEGGRVPVTEKSVAPVTSSGVEIPDMQTTMALVQIGSSTTQKSLLLASPTKDGLPSTDAAGLKSAIANSPTPAIPNLAPFGIEIPEMRSSLAPIHMDINTRAVYTGSYARAACGAAEDDNTTETHGPSQSDLVLAPGRKRQIDKSRALSEAEDLRPERR
ncbi:hypothetical protein G3M48_006243 [Beauveria asiatica]|uniref:Uncharacterized protein n=1 Tax=Beauveria asiatica TaxID=1069075 RepID=A0AAW0RPK4_9HYPO